MKKLTQPTRSAAAIAAERATRIHRLMNVGISQRAAEIMIDRDIEKRFVKS